MLTIAIVAGIIVIATLVIEVWLEHREMSGYQEFDYSVSYDEWDTDS